MAVSARRLAGAPTQAETIVVEAARYLDVVAGKLVSPAVIVVEGERIVAINPATRPAGARTIDLGQRTLLPGLMDAHVHLNYIIGEGWETEPVRFTAGDFALRAVPHATKTLLAGFTTVRDLGTGLGFSDVALMHAIDKGWVAGPRMIPAGHALSISGGHCDQSMGFGPGVAPPDFISGTADGVDEVLKAVRYQVKHGAKVIKICATAGVLSFEGPAGAQQYSLEELRAAAEEAHRHGLKIAAHAPRHRRNHRRERGGHRQHRAQLDDDGRGGGDHQEERELRRPEHASDRHAEDHRVAACARGEAGLPRAARDRELQAGAEERPQGRIRHGRRRVPARRQCAGARPRASAMATRRCTRSGARRS